MNVGSLTAEGITSLARNSPKLLTLYLSAARINVSVKHFNFTLKKMFSKRRLFTTGYCDVKNVKNDLPEHVLWGKGTDLVPLWN